MLNSTNTAVTFLVVVLLAPPLPPPSPCTLLLLVVAASLFVFSSSFSGKYKILVKPHGNSHSEKSVKANERLVFNEEFKDKQRRIKIPLLVSKSGDDKERKGNKQQVEAERRHAMEACIVRIMKARKILDHNDLIIEATEQLLKTFKPTPGMLKRRIEDLISRDYLERDDKDRKMYRYLA